MDRYQLEISAYRTYGKSIGWMCNVINTGHRNPTTKIKGLIYLAFHDRVCPLSFSMDQILVDGFAVSWTELEKYAGRYSEDELHMRAEVTQCSDRSAYTLSEAKLVETPYNYAIQIAAKALVEAGKGEYTYRTSYQSGTSVWSKPESDSTVSYEFASGSLKY